MYGSIPVLVLSALDKTETELKCLEYGVTKYFFKPFNPVDLLHAIQHLIKDNKLENII
jgi:DNA-binding response OmpR family regulator